MAAEGLRGATDEDLWPQVQQAARFLITKDLGFSDERRYPPGLPSGHSGASTRRRPQRAAAERLTAVFQAEAVEAWAECLVVVTDQKVRVRRPRPRAT
jgi:hypothetical protein